MGHYRFLSCILFFAWHVVGAQRIIDSLVKTLCFRTLSDKEGMSLLGYKAVGYSTMRCHPLADVPPTHINASLLQRRANTV